MWPNATAAYTMVRRWCICCFNELSWPRYYFVGLPGSHAGRSEKYSWCCADKTASTSPSAVDGNEAPQGPQLSRLGLGLSVNVAIWKVSYILHACHLYRGDLTSGFEEHMDTDLQNDLNLDSKIAFCSAVLLQNMTVLGASRKKMLDTSYVCAAHGHAN